MVVRYPDSRCEDSPTKAHHYIQLVGTVWRCKYCWTTVWIPTTIGDANKFNSSIGRLGLDKAYGTHLSYRPKVKELLTKLEDIRLLRKVLPEDQLSFAIASIVTDKKYELEDVSEPGPPYNNYGREVKELLQGNLI